MNRLALVLASSLCSACVAIGELELPSVEGARSIIFVTLDDGELSAHALEKSAVLTQTLSAHAKVLALYYPMPLEDMFFEPGSLPLVERDSIVPSTLLPLPLAAYEGSLELSALASAADSELFGDARIALDIEGCVEAGGCYPIPDTICLRCAEPDPPLAPDPAAPPVLVPCPRGWMETNAGGIAVCDPLGPPVPCADDELWSPGQAACRPASRACPVPPEDFPPDVDGIFVRLGANGIGTRDDPFGTLAEALATNGSTIALAAGNYGAAAIDRSVVLAGACRDTRFDSLDVTAGSVVARDLRAGQVSVATGARVELERASVIDAAGFVVNGELHAHDVVIRRSAIHAIIVQAGGMLELANAEIDACGSVGIYSTGGRVAVSDSWIHDVGYTSIVGSQGAALTAERTYFDGGLVAVDFFDTSTSTLADVVLRRFPASSLAAEDGGHITAARAWIETSSRILAKDAKLALTDTVVIGADPSEAGLLVVGSSNVRAERLHVSSSAGKGIAMGAGTQVALSDVTIEGAQLESLQSLGTLVAERVKIRGARGISIDIPTGWVELESADIGAGEDYGISLSGGTLHARKIHIDGVRGCGVLVADPETSLFAEELSIERTEILQCLLGVAQNCGTGLFVSKEAHANITGFHIAASAQTGVVLGPSFVELSRGRISANMTGIEVRPEGYAVPRLLRDVVLDANIMNLDLR